jgi:hypothetical protein
MIMEFLATLLLDSGFRLVKYLVRNRPRRILSFRLYLFHNECMPLLSLQRDILREDHVDAISLIHQAVHSVSTPASLELHSKHLLQPVHSPQHDENMLNKLLFPERGMIKHASVSAFGILINFEDE